MDAVNNNFDEARNQTLSARTSFWAGHLWTISFSIFIIVLLIGGFLGRDESYLSPTDGMGYALGIIGGSLMLLLMFYPLRKSWRVMQGWGPIKYWFQLHMLFGVLGPVLILFHSNFRLGSTNSNLALFSMLIVAGSGLIGRYLYAKIHFGLYGQKATLKDLRKDIKITRGNLGSHISLSPRIVKLIKHHEKFMISKRNLFMHFILLPYIYLTSKLARLNIYRALTNDLKKQANKNNWEKDMLGDFVREGKMYLRDYFICLTKISHLTLYARLFSLWHVLHLPLFIMLVITGIIHVLAVHMY